MKQIVKDIYLSDKLPSGYASKLSTLKQKFRGEMDKVPKSEFNRCKDKFGFDHMAFAMCLQDYAWKKVNQKYVKGSISKELRTAVYQSTGFGGYVPEWYYGTLQELEKDLMKLKF